MFCCIIYRLFYLTVFVFIAATKNKQLMLKIKSSFFFLALTNVSCIKTNAVATVWRFEQSYTTQLILTKLLQNENKCRNIAQAVISIRAQTVTKQADETTNTFRATNCMPPIISNLP